MKLRTFATASLALPLALALAACGKSDEGAVTGLSGEPIAKIAAPAGKSWAETITVTPEGGYRMGNPEAPIKIIEFGALSCSHCAEFAEKATAELRDNFVASGRVSYELRFYMLNVLDVPATLLATCGSTEAALPLADQFWGWQKEMFATLQQNEAAMQAAANLPAEQRFGAIARASGMDSFFAARGIAADQANACLANVNKATELANNTSKQSEQYQITGTPTFLINGTKVEMNTWEQLKPELQRLGAR